MRNILITFTLLTFFSTGTFAKTIITECVSDGGSLYNVTLNTNLKNGEIRYRWMGQDIFYKVGITSYNNNEIKGFAVFDKSNTGEIKGNPFEFRYNIKENTFNELNVVAKCD